MTSHVQSKFAEALTATSVSVTLTSPPTAGNLLVAVLHVSGSSGIGSSPVHPWGLSGPEASTSNAVNAIVNVYSKVAGPGESSTITFSSGTSRNYVLAVIEIAPTSGKVWNGLDTSAINFDNAVTSLALGPTGSQADTDDIAIAGICLSGTSATVPALSSSFNLVGSPPSGSRTFTGYKVLSSTAATSTTGSWTNARNTAGVLVTYRQIAPPTPTGFIGLL